MNMYYIALVAPDEINKQVLKWKQDLLSRFGCMVALRSPAHITLVPPFRMLPEGEMELSFKLNECCSRQEAFELSLKNFGAFPPRVVFVEVQKNDKLKKLKSILENCLVNIKRQTVRQETGEFHPHITLATRDLTKKSFYIIEEMFRGKNYETTWMVKSVSILRYDQKKWEVIHTSPLLHQHESPSIIHQMKG